MDQSVLFLGWELLNDWLLKLGMTSKTIIVKTKIGALNLFVLLNDIKQNSRPWLVFIGA